MQQVFLSVIKGFRKKDKKQGTKVVMFFLRISSGYVMVPHCNYYRWNCGFSARILFSYEPHKELGSRHVKILKTPRENHRIVNKVSDLNTFTQ